MQHAQNIENILPLP